MHPTVALHLTIQCTHKFQEPMLGFWESVLAHFGLYYVSTVRLNMSNLVIERDALLKELDEIKPNLPKI